jgi:hypothetical protein
MWLKINRKELEVTSAEAESAYEVGNRVGFIAQTLYDPNDAGQFFNRDDDGYDAVFKNTQVALAGTKPLFEAGFSANGALAFADVLMPVGRGTRKVWRMVEVKSNASVKSSHLEDTSIQAYVAWAAGLELKSVSIAHVDTTWVYRGGEDYDGLLTEVDVTDKVLALQDDVANWIAKAQTVAAKRTEPKVSMGVQCNKPFECEFQAYCSRNCPTVEYSVDVLPGHRSRQLTALIEDQGVTDLREIPDEVLSGKQLLVKKHTLAGKRYFDKKGALDALSPHTFPLYFLDFETINPAIPIWKGTRPYQVIPFQFSLHRIDKAGKLTHQEHLDLTGKDPAKKLAQALLDACGKRGSIFMYSPFEKTVIAALAERFATLATSLQAIASRLVDLRPIVQNHYYHPAQGRSWSIKSVLPTISTDLRYDDLVEVQDGMRAMKAFVEATDPLTTKARKAELNQILLNYCKTDTLAMVKLWQFLLGRKELKV